MTALEDGKRVGLYCSDVSGAFDRVPAERLLRKLAATGLHPRLLAVLQSWLGDRSAVVVVKGVSSSPKPLSNSVFQGTVWGPPLWNVHYEDARKSVAKLGYEETVYADDFNAFKAFDASVSDEDVLKDMRSCQGELHQWGCANQAVFDASKEEFVILHRSRSVGESFRLLGVIFDPQLRMHDAINKLAVDAGWRLRALLRSRRFHTRVASVRLYKAQVLSFLEAATPAMAHAAPSLLDRIDRVQRRFLREIGLSEVDALQYFGLAPLDTRRNIAMLGLLHKVALGIAHPELMAMFPRAPPPKRTLWTNTFGARHSKQLFEPFQFGYTGVIRRSAFGSVIVYNALPQAVIDLPVKAFQRCLQESVLRQAVRDSSNSWSSFLRLGLQCRSIRGFQACFS